MINGIKVRFRGDSWELLVAAMVVLAFFLNLSAVKHFPAHSPARRHASAAQQAGFTNFHATENNTVGGDIRHDFGASHTTAVTRGYSVKDPGSGTKSPSLPDVADRCAYVRVAQGVLRARWLTNWAVLTYDSTSTTSQYVNMMSLSSGGKPSINRLS
jgi:hypothetical protein